VSIEKRKLGGGKIVWRVRYREGGRNKAKVLGRKRDAEAFDAEIRRRKRTGEIATQNAGRDTLADFAREWWRLHVVPNLSGNTRATYAAVWDRHVLPRIGGYELRELTPAIMQRFRADLAAAGAGDATILKALTVLQSVMRLAVVQGRVQSNPAAAVKKPSQARKREVRPPSPRTVEAIRSRMRQKRDSTLLSVFAYAGLRPGEALALTWDCVRERTLLVERSIALEGHTKTRRNRTVRLVAPLAQDLAEWRLACGRPSDDAPVFPAKGGEFWRDHDWRNWRVRVFQEAAAAAGFGRITRTKRSRRYEGVRPYDLRHSFVSLLIHEGVSIVEVARQAGHSLMTCSSTYAHVIDEFDPSERMTAEAAIREARDELVPLTYPSDTVHSRR
jgi:integrase